MPRAYPSTFANVRLNDEGQRVAGGSRTRPPPRQQQERAAREGRPFDVTVAESRRDSDLAEDSYYLAHYLSVGGDDGVHRFVFGFEAEVVGFLVEALDGCVFFAEQGDDDLAVAGFG